VEGGGFELTAVVSPALPLRPSSNRTDGFPIFGSPSPVRSATFGARTKVRVDEDNLVAAYLLAEPSATVSPDTRTSVPPWLHSRYGSFIATTQDSDFSGSAARLTGPASLRGRLGLWPAAGVLPAYLDRTYRRAVHADPAGALRRRWPLPSLLPAAFTDQGAVRLVSGSKLIEAHWMWFIFITARLLIFLRFQPRLAATLLRSCSVVNSLTRRAGLSPAFRSTSLAQPLIRLD